MSDSFLDQSYTQYQQLCYDLIIHQKDYSTCQEILTYLLSSQRTIFSNEYRNFFYCMYHCAPAVLFYLMQFADARELYLQDGSLIENYDLLSTLQETSDNYEKALSLVKSSHHNNNEALRNFRKTIAHTKEQSHQQSLDTFSMLDSDGALSALPEPTEAINYHNISKSSRSIDGRTKLGRELKSLINRKMGTFNWQDLPKAKARRYNNEQALKQIRKNQSDSNEEQLLLQDLKVGLKTIKDPLTKEHFFTSPQANNNVFGLMHYLATEPTYGPLNPQKARLNPKLHKLPILEIDPTKLATSDAKNMLEKLSKFMSQERLAMKRTLIKLMTNNQQLYEIFGEQVRLLTINPLAFNHHSICLEDLEQDCFIVKIGSALQVRAAAPLGVDNNSPWLNSSLSLLISAGLELSLLKSNNPELIKDELSLTHTYNAWKQTASLKQLNECTYQIALNTPKEIPESFDDELFGPYDLLYIAL